MLSVRYGAYLSSLGLREEDLTKKDEVSARATIKKAYLDKSKILHPDKGGTNAQFQSLEEAHRILNDDLGSILGSLNSLSFLSLSQRFDGNHRFSYLSDEKDLKKAVLDCNEAEVERLLKNSNVNLKKLILTDSSCYQLPLAVFLILNAMKQYSTSEAMKQNEAEREKMLRIIELLMGYIDLTSYGTFLLKEVVELNKIEIVRLLLPKVNQNDVKGYGDEHPLITAAINGNDDIVNELLNDKNFNPTWRSDSRKTLLMITADCTTKYRRNDLEGIDLNRLRKLTKSLLEKGVDIDADDSISLNGETAFLIAVSQNNTPVAEEIGLFLINRLNEAKNAKNADIKKAISQVIAAAEGELSQLIEKLTKPYLDVDAKKKNKDIALSFQKLINSARIAIQDSSKDNMKSFKEAIDSTDQSSFSEKFLGALLFLAGVLLIGLGIAGLPILGGISMTKIVVRGGLCLTAGGAALFCSGTPRGKLTTAMLDLESSLRKEIKPSL